ncbi:hypothetical protein LV779_36165 [Streptomyces thinghirensis]|nr:hypothetical protein [Streptomyces thinghirensis]
MRWFDTRGGDIDAFHQAMLLEVPGELRQDHLVAAVQALAWTTTTRCGWTRTPGGQGNGAWPLGGGPGAVRVGR